MLRNLLDPLFVKNRNKIILYSSMGVLDANMVCVRAFLERSYSEFQVVVIKGKRKRSMLSWLKVLFSCFTSYYIIVDHAIPRFLTNRKRKIFNVWHGIPLKTIRHLDKKRFSNEFLDFESKNLDGLVCSSVLDQAVMAACFNVPPSKCILSGLPRMDLLESESVEWFTDPQEKTLIKQINGRNLISWMPTYRGKWSNKKKITAFSYEDEILLRDFLIKNNAVLGVRPHKFSKLQKLTILGDDNLLIDLKDFEITNTILKHTHTLITDYSSVWLDFSIVSSNICLFLFDADDYEDERGTIYPLNEVLSGHISYNFPELLSSLQLMVKQGHDAVSEPSSLFFRYRDNLNTKRFVEHVLSKNV